MNKTNTSVALFAVMSGETGILYFRIIACSVITCFCFVSFVIMTASPRTAPNIRYLSSNIIFYDICVAILYALHYSIMDSPTWFYYRATMYSVMGQWFAVTAFSFERLLAIASPFKYRRYCKKAYVRRFVAFEFICFLAIIGKSWSIEHESNRARLVCWAGISVHAVLSCICLICITATLVIFRNSLTQFRSSTNRFSENTRVISRSKEIVSVACIFFVVAHIPIEIEGFVLRCEFDPTVPLYTNFVLIINSALDPILYVWRFRESRLQMLKCLSLLPCFRCLERTVERRRMDIYNIPIAEHVIHRKRNCPQI